MYAINDDIRTRILVKLALLNSSQSAQTNFGHFIKAQWGHMVAVVSIWIQFEESRLVENNSEL